MEGILGLGQTLVGAWGGAGERGGERHADRRVRSLEVVLLDEAVERGLLQEMASGRAGGHILQRQLHALVATPFW